MRTLSIRQIEIFHAIMTTGSATAAASLLCTSQPTISREIARMEEIIQFKLFNRTKGRLVATIEGKRLFEEVQHSWSGLAKIIKAADSIRLFQQAQLTICCLPMFSLSFLPTICQQFFSLYPDISVVIHSLESPQLEDKLIKQTYDIGIVENTLTLPGTKRETLFTLDEVCILPEHHLLAKHHYLTPNCFHQEKFINLSPGDHYRQLLDSLFAQNNIIRKLVMETDNAISVCELVAKGIGLSIINPLTAYHYQQQQRSPNIVIRPFVPAIPFTVSLIEPLYRPDSLIVKEFIKLVHDASYHYQTMFN